MSQSETGNESRMGNGHVIVTYAPYLIHSSSNDFVSLLSARVCVFVPGAAQGAVGVFLGDRVERCEWACHGYA